MLYRWTKRTPAGTTPPIKYGEVIRANDARLKAEARDQLIKSGTLAPVTTPPLSELPGWEERAETLQRVGVITITDLLAVNVAGLAKSLKRTPRTIRDWQSEAERWLNPEQPTSNRD
jgi:hypothetical protein